MSTPRPRANNCLRPRPTMYPRHHLHCQRRRAKQFAQSRHAARQRVRAAAAPPPRHRRSRLLELVQGGRAGHTAAEPAQLDRVAGRPTSRGSSSVLVDLLARGFWLRQAGHRPDSSGQQPFWLRTRSVRRRVRSCPAPRHQNKRASSNATWHSEKADALPRPPCTVVGLPAGGLDVCERGDPSI